MNDFLLVLIIVAFFGLAVLFVRLCGSIVGEDTVELDDTGTSIDDEVVAS